MQPSVIIKVQTYAIGTLRWQFSVALNEERPVYPIPTSHCADPEEFIAVCSYLCGWVQRAYVGDGTRMEMEDLTDAIKTMNQSTSFSERPVERLADEWIPIAPNAEREAEFIRRAQADPVPDWHSLAPQR